MPTNKNALLRYRILDDCFRNRQRHYYIEDLVDKVNEAFLDLYGETVSLRQIRDDIKHMRDRVSYNAPIETIPYEGKRCIYRYSDSNFSIFKSELKVEETAKLRSTIEMLGRFRGIPGNGWLEEVISSLEYRFGIKGIGFYGLLLFFENAGVIHANEVAYITLKSLGNLNETFKCRLGGVSYPARNGCSVFA